MSMKGQGMSKYNVLIGYTVFFVLLQILIVGFAGDVFSSSVADITIPECNGGFIILDGLLNCALSYIQLFINLFTVSTTILVIELIFVIPFVIALVLIIADLIRGSG